MNGRKLVPISVLKDCGMVVYQDDVDRMDIKVHEGDDGIKRVAWSSVQRLAKYHWPYGGVGHDKFLNRIWIKAKFGKERKLIR